METTETKKRADKPVQLTIAKLPGRRYEEDKPRDCRYCYYWAGRIRGCSRRPFIRIGGEEKPSQIVKSRFMKLDGEHIRYVLNCFAENTTKVRNIKQYLLAALYNAPMTIGSYYTALVNHDMYGTD